MADKGQRWRFGLAKSFQDSSNGEKDKALASLSQTLLVSIGREAICADPGEYAKFQKSILELEKKLREPGESAEIYAVSAAVDKALQEYRSKSTTYLKNQAAELQSMASAAIRTMAEIHANGSESAASLKDLERQVQVATSAASLAECRTKLGDCLSTLRGESERQQQKTNEMVSRLRSELNHNGPIRENNPSGADPVSGLPSRPDAEAVLTAQINNPAANTFAVLFCVQRVDIINKKYGYEAGDQMLRTFLDHMRQYMTIVDQLFRWSGPAFLAVAQRPGGEDSFRWEIARIVGKRLEHELVLNKRSALLPITSSSLMLDLAKEGTVEEVVKKLDEFVASSP